MGNFTLTAISKLYDRPDPLLSFKWVTKTLPVINGLLPGGGDMARALSYVESVDLPFNNIKIADNWYGGSGYTYFAGPHDISSFAITFYEDQKASALKYIQAWKNLVKSFDSGLYNVPGNGDGTVGYKRNISVDLLDSKNNVVVSSRMIGLWPADTGNLSLNYTDTGRIIISQTFSCDSQELVFS